MPLEQSPTPALTRNASLATSPGSGRGETTSSSRGANRTRVLRIATRVAKAIEKPLLTYFADHRYSPFRYSPSQQTNGSGTPAGVCVHPPRLRAARVLRTRSPVGVPPRLLPSGLSPLSLSSRPGFLGRGGSASSYQARPNRGAKDSRAAKRALPAPACPSPGNAPPGPVVMPVSMMPEAARERSVSFRPRAPHSLRIGEYPRPKASVDERDL